MEGWVGLGWLVGSSNGLGSNPSCANQFVNITSAAYTTRLTSQTNKTFFTVSLLYVTVAACEVIIIIIITLSSIDPVGGGGAETTRSPWAVKLSCQHSYKFIYSHLLDSNTVLTDRQLFTGYAIKSCSRAKKALKQMTSRMLLLLLLQFLLILQLSLLLVTSSSSSSSSSTNFMATQVSNKTSGPQ